MNQDLKTNNAGCSLKSSNDQIKSSIDKYLIDLNDYQIKTSHESRAFTIVYDQISYKEYATKTFLLKYNLQDRSSILQEISNLIFLQHPTLFNINGFSYEDFNGNDNLTVITNVMKEGSLSSCLPINSDSKKQIILIGITRAMMLLHEQGIIHRHLKAENVLLDDDFYPRLTDFCLSKFSKLNTSDPNSLSYLAPEVIKKNLYTKQSDVYAFGILMFEIISGHRAFYHNKGTFNRSKFLHQVSKQNLKPRFDFPIKNGLKRMIEACWSIDPNERPTFSELFTKLTMSGEDFNMDRGEFNCRNVLKTSDYYTYCLDGVDEEKIFNYLSEILDDALLIKDDDNELKKLKEKVEELNPKTIVPLKKENEELKEEINRLKKQIENSSDEHSS